jgi:hypothetical protein
MPQVTENTVNDLLAAYLREKGLSVTTQPGVLAPRRRTPDFDLRNGVTVYGEGEWFSSYEKGLAQAVDYGDIPGASGYFIIGYPDDLKDKIRQNRLGTASPEILLDGVTYRGMFKLKGEATSLFRGGLVEIPSWMQESLARRPRPPDAAEFIHLMQDIVRGLTEFLPSHGEFPSLFEHIIAAMPKARGEIETARQAAAYLLLNQVVFYHILQQRGYPRMSADTIQDPGSLKTQYFDIVLKDDYQAIFNFDVASLFPLQATDYIRDMVRIIDELQPEQFTRDLLGNIFHSLIPLEVRKPVAAYYTNPIAARLLAKLAIDGPLDRVADFACGSGTLLMAAYDRKNELLDHPIDQETHRRFVEDDLTGTDIMPFAAHLAVVQLALRNPGYLTDRVRIAVYDSTTLEPNTVIRSLQGTMPHGQSRIDAWAEGGDPGSIRVGAVSGAGAGRGFKVGKVDVAIMNPPFTRKQHLKTDFRSMLTDRFSDYTGYTTKEMNFFTYFIFLADRFLDEGGRLAMVLPATVLRQLSSKGVRLLLSKKYQIEYIIQSGYRLAFSESTSFREILLVAKKRKQSSKGNGPCVIARLEVKPTLANVDVIERALKDTRKFGALTTSILEEAHRAGIKLSLAPQSVLRASDNWYQLLPDEGFGEYKLPPSSVLQPLGQINVKVVQGIRFHEGSDRVDVKNTVLSKPRNVNAKINWRIEKDSGNNLIATSVTSGARVEIPKFAVRPTTRTAAGMETLEITDPPDYIVVERFPGDNQFWDDPDPDALLQRRLPHLESRETFLIAAGRNNINLIAPGTHLLAFVSTRRIPPTWNFWSLQTSKLEDSKLLSLWWNSTFHLVQLMENRAEVGGAWVGWLKDTLLKLRVINSAALPKEAKKELLDVYDQWKHEPFPTLVEQLKTRFEGRVAIDRAVGKAVWGEEKTPDMVSLYDTLASRIEWLGNLMGKT